MSAPVGPGEIGRAIGELTIENAEGYLRALGAVVAPARIEALGGGISNVVLEVRSDDDCFVVKQSLSRLRVKDVWEFDQRRILVERRCMEYLGGLLAPGAVPAVRFADDGNFLFAMSCAPPGGVNWKEALLAGDVRHGAAQRAGALLAEIQVRAAADAAARELFSDQTVLVQGRIDPYHRTAALIHPRLTALIDEEVERLLATRQTLVLGDYSPKNTIVYEDALLVLDFEVAHFGDPGFDPAFCLTHLLLKAIYRPECAERLLAAARGFWQAYLRGLAGAWARSIEAAVARELGCLILARVDGKSKVEYLTDERHRALARQLATDVLVDAVADPEQVFTELEVRLRPAEHRASGR